MELSVDKNPYALSYYSKLTQDYDSGNIRQPEVILPSVPVVSKDSIELPSPQQYLLPSVILWDPLQQLQCFSDGGIKCPHECHGIGEEATLEPRKSKKGEYWWQAGQRVAVTPRLLCSSSWPVVLLSRIYFCKGNMKHRSYIAHDPEIIGMIPSCEADQIPFVLLHRTGFAKELSDTVVSLVSSGDGLEKIEQTITQQHISNFAQCKAKYEEDIQLCSDVPERPPAPFPEYKPVGVPSMEMLLGSLLINYPEKEPYYAHRMSELSASILLMGHFFKASQQMGTFKQGNKRWVPKYDYIFAVMNEKGQVLAWQATKGTSCKDVLPLVQGVQRRLAEHGCAIELILTPDCCALREQLQSIFGPGVQVKIDPSFAVRKLEKRFKIRKCDQNIMKTCLQNFDLVFRQALDIELCRTLETPTSDVIRGNLEAFVLHWKAIKGDSGERLLHEPALRELNALHRDVSNACASGIPPTCGTLYVSLLRDHLRPVLHRRFLNADLTLPAISSLLYIWNEMHSGSDGPVMPINSYKDALDLVGFALTTERFGLVAHESGQATQTSTPISDCSSFQYTFDVHSVQCLIAAALGVVDQDAEPEEEARVLTDSTLNKVYHLAQNYHVVQQSLNSLRPHEVTVNPRLLHLSTSSVLLFSRSDCEVHDQPGHGSRLTELVSRYSGVLLGESNDADGFFIALAGSLALLLRILEHESAKESKALREHLKAVGYDPDKLNDEQVNVVTLRKIISNEWLSNKENYARLLMSPLLDLTEEAQRFCSEGYCKADLLNLLPVAAARVFRLPIILFTSLELFPIVPIAPAGQLVARRCIYMGYSAAGYGTYYTVDLEVIPHVPPPTSKPRHACRCGLGNSKDKKNRQFCIHVKGMYLTRCECFRNGVGCGYLCRCFNCANPDGTSGESRAQRAEPKTRLRARHKFQKARRSNAEDESSNRLSELENLVLECLVDTMHNPRQGLWVLEAPPEIVLQQYVSLLQVTSDAKTLDDVKHMLKVFMTNVEEFATMYKKQTELNLVHQLESFPVTGDLNDPECNQVLVIVESTEQI